MMDTKNDLQTRVPRKAISDQAPLDNPTTTSDQEEPRSLQSTRTLTRTGIEQSVSSIETLLVTNEQQEESNKRHKKGDNARLSSDMIVDSGGSFVKGEEKTQCHFMMNWILAIFVFSILSWVNIWNILAAHTKVARDKIYPFFESTYFPKKAGARVFTFLGVFYILAGAVSLFCLSCGMHLPKPMPFMVRPLHFFTGENWTIFELFVLGVFVSVQIAIIITRVENRFYDDWQPNWDPPKLWYEVTKTLGKTAAVTLLFLFIPVSKSCFWLDLFNMKFERAIKFHRWLAWFLVTTVAFHAASAIASFASAGQFKNCMWPSENCAKPEAKWGTYESLEASRKNTYGWLSMLIAIPLVITSLPWFRRHKFEWFYFTHFLFIPVMVLLHLHFDDMIYYAAPGLAAYILDKVLWFCSSRRAIRIVNLTTPVRGFVRMEIAVEQKAHTFEPGQWVQIKVPAVSTFQWHPFSVASAPGHSTITIDIKVVGNWTRGLQDLALRFDPSKYTHTCVFMDHFHGSSHMQMQGYLTHPAVLMIAGGIGLAPMICSLRMLVENGIPTVRRAVLVWVVRKESVVDLYREELAYFQSIVKTKFGCEVDVIVHATLSEKEDASDFVAFDIDSTPNASAATHCKQWPFRRHLMGYGHLLVLTIGAGGGYLLGIFLANYFALDKHWRAEYVVLLQLSLAVFFDGIMVAIGMSRSYFVQGSVWTGEDVHHGVLTPKMSSRLSSTSRSTLSKIVSPHSSNGRSRELNVVLGCRPDLDEIFRDMKAWCEADGFFSVGVSVCGPDKLIQSVIKTCKQASSPSLQFVVDDETFEW